VGFSPISLDVPISTLQFSLQFNAQNIAIYAQNTALFEVSQNIQNIRIKGNNSEKVIKKHPDSTKSVLIWVSLFWCERWDLNPQISIENGCETTLFKVHYNLHYICDVEKSQVHYIFTI